MELLEFARGPALTFAITVFIFGTVFRIVSLMLMWRTRDSSEGNPAARPAFVAALHEIVRRLWPQSAYKQRTMFMLINGYVFHVGLAIIVFLLLPHILFIEDLVGLSWPGLPNNVIYAVSIITAVSLIAQLVMRLANPAQRIISTFDDYFSWIATFLPVVTGIIATSHLGARYETLLALHILSVALLLVYMPFGKMMHWFLVFVTRSQTGAHLSHRGAQL
ncbi:MAG: nitrate reductase [Xanthomonadales bacterium]|jgi:nitrate reductase gamma subunit|nr:nitrate reductase [Gammaproteobacteria bacterium]NNK31948.1 nitrate reductase [Xanthomonadales bacterium]NNK37008.1 nitrate reductase [Xanthomonadales bacterium]